MHNRCGFKDETCAPLFPRRHRRDNWIVFCFKGPRTRERERDMEPKWKLYGYPLAQLVVQNGFANCPSQSVDLEPAPQPRNRLRTQIVHAAAAEGQRRRVWWCAPCLPPLSIHYVEEHGCTFYVGCVKGRWRRNLMLSWQRPEATRRNR